MTSTEPVIYIIRTTTIVKVNIHTHTMCARTNTGYLNGPSAHVHDAASSIIITTTGYVTNQLESLQNKYSGQEKEEPWISRVVLHTFK